MSAEEKNPPATEEDSSTEPDPSSDIAKAEAEYMAKFGKNQKKSNFAQRKMMMEGKRYFDSGDHSTAGSKSRKEEVASRPHLPLMNQQKAKRPSVTSKLVD